jgi:transcriptional regulator with XRE-family HTH domain
MSDMATTRDPKLWAELGEWIAIRRRQLGMDQRQLAEAAGVSENTISNYERGRVPTRGKVPPGYYRVEQALHFARGSIDATLRGGRPTFAFDGPADEMMAVRDPDDPAFADNPLLRAVVVRINEAMRYMSGAELILDLADRWGVSRETIKKYQDSLEDVLAEMFSPGHGPPEVQAYHAAMAAGEVPKSDAMEKRPDLGWMAYAVDHEKEEKVSRVGYQLLRARLAKEIEPETMSDLIKVPVDMIQRIERDDFSFPGAAMHVPIYIRLMAAPLEIDPEPLIDQFKAEHPDSEV